MNSVVKKLVLTVVACACAGSYNCYNGNGGYCYDAKAAVVQTAETGGTVKNGIEPYETILPMPTSMPSPMREFKTVEEAARYININPQLPKVLPVGFNIESVSTINKDILQVVYIYQPGEDTSRNQAAGTLINYRVSNLKEDISGDYNDYKVTESETVDGTEVTFKGGKKMVYLATWMKDGQSHAIYFERPVTREMAKGIIANVAVQTMHHDDVR